MEFRQKRQTASDSLLDSPTVLVVGGESAEGLTTSVDETAAVSLATDRGHVVRQVRSADIDAHESTGIRIVDTQSVPAGAGRETLPLLESDI